jgi:hypothetical protein
MSKHLFDKITSIGQTIEQTPISSPTLHPPPPPWFNSLSVVKDGRMVLLAYVMRVGGRVGPEIATVPQSQTLLRGARAGSRQAPPLVLFDTDVVKIRVGKSWDCRDAVVSLLLLESSSPVGVERTLLLLSALGGRGGLHRRQEGLRPGADKG